jgi:hypothetical protein
VFVPQIHLRQPRDNRCARTVTAIEDANQLILILVAVKFAILAIKSYHAPGTRNTHIVHCSFTSYNQNFLHDMIPFLNDFLLF